MIFTFYSYKGGVGRSMALATVSRMLAGRGLRVLCVDFDLEAPGLEHYFYEGARSDDPRRHPGLMDLIRSYRQALTDEAAFEKAEFMELRRFTQTVRGEVGTLGGRVDLMTAGQREPPEKERDYAFEVRGFDWQDFYFNWKGDRFFEWLRRQWNGKDGYDVVLVDSRTGITEMGGVCAYQLADAVVLLCAPNYQNLRGTRAVAVDFRSESVTALRGRRKPLQILAVPARIENEHPRRAKFLADFAADIGALPPKLASAGLTYESLALPYLRELAIAEPQIDDHLDDKELLKPIYAPFARLADALTLLAEPPDRLARLCADALARLRGDEAAITITPLEANTSQSSSGYDVFLDFGMADQATAEVLTRRCQEAGVTVFIDSAAGPGEPWSERIERALDYSATLLVCFGASGSSAYRADLLKRARQLTRLRIVPLLLPGADVSALKSFGLDEVQYIDSRSGLTDTVVAEIVAVLKRPAVSQGDASADGRDPYPGARPYTEDDAAFFFGRDDDIAAVVEALGNAHGVLLEGPAKSGKSSLAAAGVMPRLRALTGADGPWTVHRLAYVDATREAFELPDWARRPYVPSAGPGRASDVVVIDGLDTAFGSSTRWRTQRFNRVSHLIEAAGPELRVLVVWRGALPDDTYADIVDDLKDRGFRHRLVEPLRGEAQRRAIEQPARTAGHLLENGLVERLIESAGSARSSMLQIQLALVDLWKERRRGWLSNRTLDALGHLAGVFHKHLKSTLADTHIYDRAAAGALFTALIDVNTDGEPVPRPLPLTQVNTLSALARTDASALTESLAGAGLLDLWRVYPEAATSAAPTGVRVCMVRSDVTPYFEAVGASIDLGFLTWRASLATQLTRWQATNHAAETLLTDKALADAEDWLARHGGALVEEERAFIEASLNARAARHTALKVSVTHGDVCEVAAPLIVGHYQSFRLTGSEAVLDTKMGGVMQRALQLGLYPTAVGMQQVFKSRAADPMNPWRVPRPEAVIVTGLGREGDLGTHELTLAVKQAVIGWAEAQRESAPSTATFEIAATLVGSSGMGVDVGLSAESVVQGVHDANTALAGRKWPEVGRLTVVERYLDRATDAFRALQQRALANDRLEVDDTVHTGIGGLARPLSARYRGAGYDLITALTIQAESGPAIAYTLATSRSRNDVKAVAGGVALVREMVASLAQEGKREDSHVGRALFQLLVPSALEAFFHGSAQMLLQLDTGTAAIPWEALTPDQPGEPSAPWAVRAKVIRSIRTASFVALPADASADVAVLVVGEPAADLSLHPRLPGARREALSVVETLTAPGSLPAESVKALVSGAAPETRPDATAVVGALFERAWRVLHVCAHVGLSSAPGTPPGILLSSGAFLGAREIQSMRVMPELVFVSATHAAAPLERPLEGRGSFGFAGELAESLMAVGVRCVVVTAFGVDEEAAVRFTTTLYRELLAGQRFADATARARSAAHELGGLTWAAYQCYGDPEWRLRRSAAESPQSDRPVAEELLRVSSASDLALALETITVNARLSRGTRDEHRATLTRLEERFNPRWGHRGQVAEGFGFAWAATGDAEKAVAWFERALDAGDGAASSRAAEQAASLRVRLAVANVEAAARQLDSGAARPGRTRPIADRAYKEALKGARREIERSLEQLQALAKERPTLERYSLCGNAYRRLAALERMAGKGKEETRALEGMRRQFQAAEEIAHRTQDVNAYYPAMSRMEADLALNAGRTGWKGLHSSDIANTRTSLTQLVSVEPDFWSVIALTELKLFEAISDRKLAQRRAGIAQELADVHARASARPLWLAVQDRASVVLGKYAERATPRERIAANGLRDTIAALLEKTEAV